MKSKSLNGIADDDWRTESDLRILMDAEAIHKDAKRHKAVCALAKARLLDLAGIAKKDGGEY